MYQVGSPIVDPVFNNHRHIVSTILVLGLGKTGKATAHFFHERHCRVIGFDDSLASRNTRFSDFDSIVTDVRDVPFSEITFVVQSPGVGLDHPVSKDAKNRDIPIYSDIDVFVRSVKGSTCVGITGTNGKSTTTALTYHILKQHFPKVFMGGNIGEPVLNLPICSDAFYVLELSSFQLELSHPLHLDIAALTNITPDHLSRHHTMENYVQAKAKIFDQARCSIICCDDDWTKKICDQLEKSSKGELKEIFLDHNPILKQQLRMMTDLPGDHNLQNVALASSIARWLGLSEQEITSSVHSFAGLEHRIEFVDQIDGISFFNDSKSTNADSLIQALKSFPSSDIFLIAGGRAKSDGIVPALPFLQNVRHIFLIGEAIQRFEAELHAHIPDQNIHDCQTLQSALQHAFHFAKQDPSLKQKIILLSPACASFDQFSSFEERGQMFKRFVQEFHHD